MSKWLDFFEVTDIGIAINKENLEIIFEKFRQIDDSLFCPVFEGGLGLAITRHLVQLHGGGDVHS